MWQILGATTLILGASSYFLYTEVQSLNKQIVTKDVLIQEQKASYEMLQTQSTRQAEQINVMQSRNQEIELEMARYLDIFKRHNLTRLAAAKPGLIETRANNATKDVFETLEADSRSLDSLDDGSQLAETTGSGSSEASTDRNNTTDTPEGN